MIVHPGIPRSELYEQPVPQEELSPFVVSNDGFCIGMGPLEMVIGFTVKGEFPETPPPGAGLVTVTLTVPIAAMSAAVMAAVSRGPVRGPRPACERCS